MVEKRQKIHKHKSSAQKPSKEEMQMAKYVRFNTPKKTTILQKQSVEYFVGSKAVDTLMKSIWSKQTKKSDPLLQGRGDAVHFMEQLLLNKMLYRAKRVLKEQNPTKFDQKSKISEIIDGNEISEKVRKRKKGQEEKKEVEEKLKESETKKSDQTKKKKKYKLEVHEEQIFLDSSDIYVWVYDPISTKKMLLGGALLFGIIGATLFPLWPPSVQMGVYYLSLCGATFLGAVIGVATCRSILFSVIWLITLGKHRFWFLPNLLADVGFFDSFKPVYTHDVRGGENKAAEKEKQSDSEKEEDSFEQEPKMVPGIVNNDESCYHGDETQKPDDISSSGDASESNASEAGDTSQKEESASDYEIIGEVSNQGGS